MTAEPNLAPPPQHPGARRPPEHGSRNPYATYVDLDAPASAPRPAPPPPPPPGPPPMAYFAPVTPPKRRGAGRTAVTVLAIVGTVLAGCAGVGTYGVSAYVESKVCAQFAEMGAGTPRAATAGAARTDATPGGVSGHVIADGSLEQPTGQTDQLRKGAGELRRASTYLVFAGDVKRPTLDVAADMEDTASLLDDFRTTPGTDRAEALQQLQAIVNRIDTHARQGQQACGQTEKGFVL